MSRSRRSSPGQRIVNAPQIDELQDDKASTLYAILPTSIRKRLRRLPSLRRSASGYGRSLSSYSISSRSSDDTLLGTPPPEYTSRLSLSEPVSDNEEFEDAADGLYRMPGTSAFSAAETQSGIRWKFANQGLSLLNLAGQESAAASSDRENGSPSLVRQLYIHGISYLLRGLPNNLSSEEKMTVSSAVPEEVVVLRKVKFQSTDVIHVKSSVGFDAKGEKYQTPSILHRALAAMIVQMFLIVQFLLPYIKVFLAAAYRYERQHRISERVLSSSINTMDGVMKRSMEVSDTVGRMNDGKVGQALNELAVWWIRGVTGGIHDGVAEGLIITGLYGKGKQGQQ